MDDGRHDEPQHGHEHHHEHGDEPGQWHFDPATYLATAREEVPAYEELQETIAAATAGRTVARVLDLGTGTGETLRRVADLHRDATLVGVDESAPMLEHARDVVPSAELHVARLQEPLPEGPFDVVVSGLAVHHLDPDEKRDLFRRVAAVLAPGGRFVLGDLIVPEDPSDAVTPIERDYDLPSRLGELLAWLADAALDPAVAWLAGDLAVLTADRTTP